MSELRVTSELRDITIEELRELLKKEYKTALEVQDGVNLSGIVHSFSRAVTLLSVYSDRVGKGGTNYKNHHPISVLYASKIASLTGCEDSETFRAAYNKVKSVIEGTCELE